MYVSLDGVIEGVDGGGSRVFVGILIMIMMFLPLSVLEFLIMMMLFGWF